MLFKWIAAVLLIACIISILTTYKTINKKYKKYHLQAIVKSSAQNSKTEKYVGILVEAFGAVIISVMLLSMFLNYYNEYLLLMLIVSYLIIYYINQYLPRADWVIYKDGLISSRSRIGIEWQNIKNYRWLSKNSQSILIIEFKGKGIITQRADFKVSSDQKQQVEQILGERVNVY